MDEPFEFMSTIFPNLKSDWYPGVKIFICEYFEARNSIDRAKRNSSMITLDIITYQHIGDNDNRGKVTETEVSDRTVYDLVKSDDDDDDEMKSVQTQSCDSNTIITQHAALVDR
jgi:hypothetical protein